MNGQDANDADHSSIPVGGMGKRYDAAVGLAQTDRPAAETALQRLAGEALEPELMARVQNDLGVLTALRGAVEMAAAAFAKAIALQPHWSVPRQNADLIGCTFAIPEPTPIPAARATRIAIVSLLFNWPSTGGGTIHTAELARCLGQAGYDVRHFVIDYEPWAVGQVTEPVDWPIEVLEFTETDWSRVSIQRRVRDAVAAFAPDHVIITDSWNFKPRLAEALTGYSCFLRLAAQECLCPLSNIRLLIDSRGGWQSCPRHQLASPDVCRTCVEQRNALSGALHRDERALAGYHDADYDACLRRAFADATGILVVNPLIAECVKPYSRAVYILPSGFDARRFPNPSPLPPTRDGCLRLLFAGVVEEPMKGFAVLQAACQKLWERRQDFRLLVTASPTGPHEEFVDYVGWQSQQDLPALIAACDILVCPTIAEEALGRTAVEAMGAGRPVIASRIGGLPFVVLEEATGLLARPNDADDLAQKISRLLDDRALRERFGIAGRKRFEDHFTWEVMLPTYAALLGGPVQH